MKTVVKKYPNPCHRCGMCCLAETCPVGMDVYGLEKHERCPALKFNKDLAICLLVEKNLVPVGDGCCIKARAFRKGVEYDFASLPRELKINAVQAHKKREAEDFRLRLEMQFNHYLRNLIQSL